MWQCKLVGWLLFIFLFNGMSRSCVPSSSSSFLPTEYSSSSSSRLVAVCSVCTQNNIREQIISSWLPKAHYNLSLRKSIQHLRFASTRRQGKKRMKYICQYDQTELQSAKVWPRLGTTTTTTTLCASGPDCQQLFHVYRRLCVCVM